MDRQRFLEQLGDVKAKPVDLAEFPLFTFKVPEQRIEWEQVEKILSQQSIGTCVNNKKGWTDGAYVLLLWVVIKYAERYQKDVVHLAAEDWQQISKIVEWKDSDSCKFKWLMCMKTNIQQKMWTPQEDQLLYSIIVKNGMTFHWNEIAHEMYNRSDGQYFRKGKQYRERWNNYLNPQMKRGIWTEEEDIKLLEIALQVGLRWSLIAKKLTQRTENSVKNRFKSLINKEKKLRNMKLVQPEKVQMDMKKYEDKYGLDQELVEIMLTIIERIRNSQQVRPQEFQNLNTPNINTDQLRQEQFLKQMQFQFQLQQQQNYQMMQMQQMQQMQQYYLQMYQMMPPLYPPQFMYTGMPAGIPAPVIPQVKMELDAEQPKSDQQEPERLSYPKLEVQVKRHSTEAQKIQMQVQSPSISESVQSQCSIQIKQKSSSSSSDPEPKPQKAVLVSNQSSNHNISTNSNGSVEVLRKRLINLHMNTYSQKNHRKQKSISNSSGGSSAHDSPLQNPKEIRKVRGGSQLQRQVEKEYAEPEAPGSPHLPRPGGHVKKLSRFYYQFMEQ